MSGFLQQAAFNGLKMSLIIFLHSRLMEADQPVPDGELLVTLVRMKMPFGKYQGIVLCDLPVSYLEWFAKKGFPAGKLGMLLATLYEIKINGLDYLLKPLRNK
jgi:uncharacterized protein